MEPTVLLMENPAPRWTPLTLAMEDLIGELKVSYTIVIVTHNMQQAARDLRPHHVFKPAAR